MFKQQSKKPEFIKQVKKPAYQPVKKPPAAAPKVIIAKKKVEEQIKAKIAAAPALMSEDIRKDESVQFSKLLDDSPIAKVAQPMNDVKP